jgi:3-phenylpropionate/trans-cinnamate dioxygenase ferredoxin subunit
MSVPGVGSIGIFNVRGTYYALKSSCPHQGAPLCEGRVTGTTAVLQHGRELPTAVWTREGEIVRCPWHGWEFDILTGRALCDPPWRVATFEVVLDEVSGDEARTSVETFPVNESGGMLYLVVKK